MLKIKSEEETADLVELRRISEGICIDVNGNCVITLQDNGQTILWENGGNNQHLSRWKR